MTKLFLELELQQKGNKQTKKGLIVSELLRFSRQEWVQKIKLFKYYTEKDKNENWTDLSLLGQEPTFKVTIPYLNSDKVQSISSETETLHN